MCCTSLLERHQLHERDRVTSSRSPPLLPTRNPVPPHSDAFLPSTRPAPAAAAGAPLPADRRRKWCDVAKNLEGRTFDTEHVWTFHIWQHLIDFSSYRLSVGGFLGLDLTAALNGQPLQLTCKDTEVRRGSMLGGLSVASGGMRVHARPGCLGVARSSG